MSTGWIDAVAFMDAVDAPRFERIVQHTLSGVDVTYCPHDVLGVDLPTDEDEALFRLSLLNETTMKEMRRIEPRRYAVSPCLTDDVHRCLVQKAFEGIAAPLKMFCMEIRDEIALDRLGAGLADEHDGFGAKFPTIYV